MVSGNWAEGPSSATGRPISGSLSVFFGGMEFRLSEQDGLASVGTDGKVAAQRPVSLDKTGDALSVTLSDGATLRFSTRFEKGTEDLVVVASPVSGSVEQRIPFRPLRSSRIAELGDGRPAVLVGQDSYTFSGANTLAAERLLSVRAKRPSFSYGKVRLAAEPTLADFFIPGTDKVDYDRAVARWTDAALGTWERAMSRTTDEAVVVSYVEESSRRGAYHNAIASTPKAFVDSPSRTYRSAPYFGGLEVALRGMLAGERESLSHISRLLNEHSRDLLSESGLISFVYDRASSVVLSDIATFAQSIDPATIDLSSAVGILECWGEWDEYVASGPTLLGGGSANGDGSAPVNPFSRLIAQSEFVLQSGLRKIGDGLYLVNSDRENISFSIRAGAVAQRYGFLSGKADWISIGRGLVVTALTYADAQASLPALLSLPEGQGQPGATKPAPATADRLSASTIYPMVAPRDLGPRAVSLSSSGYVGLWAWTAADAVRCLWQNHTLTLECDFPVGETHYLLLRGVAQFQRIQIYGVDYRTDPRFERWNSSGYVYDAASKTLLLKVRHKTATEVIRLIYE